MAKQLFANNASSTLNGALTNVATTIYLAAGTGVLFPSPTGGDYFYATLDTSSGTREIVKCTARSTDTLTVVRGQEGTTAVSWVTGSKIEARITKATLESLQTLGGTTDSIVVGANAYVGQPPNWQASTQYYIGDVVKATANSNMFAALFNAYSNVTQPTWNASEASTTTDGAQEWVFVGAYTGADGGAAVGAESTVAMGSGTALGYRAASGAYGVALGASAIGIDEGVAIGAWSSARVYDSVAIGAGSKVNVGTNQYGGVALGAYAEAASEYSVALGADAVNRIPFTSVVTGMPMVRKDNAEDAALEHINYASSAAVIFSKEISLKTLLDDAATITVPSGATFFPDELGVIITSASGVTGNPDVSFGITGNTTALISSQTITAVSVKNRTSFTSATTPALSKNGINSLTASVKTAATGTTLLARFYAKGILVEDE